MTPLDQSGSIAIFNTEVAGFISFVVRNFQKLTMKENRVKWQLTNEKTDLSDVAELAEGVYLLHLKWVGESNLIGRILVYDSNHSSQPLQPLKTCNNDRVHSLMSLG